MALWLALAEGRHERLAAITLAVSRTLHDGHRIGILRHTDGPGHTAPATQAGECGPSALLVRGLLRALEKVFGPEAVVDDAEQEDRDRCDERGHTRIGEIFGERIIEGDDGG